MLNSPEEAAPFNKQVADAQAKVTIAEQTVVNLRRTKISEEVAIQQLIKRREELETQLREMEVTLEESIAIKKDHKNRLLNQIKILGEENTELEINSGKIKKELEKLKGGIEKSTSILEEAKIEHTEIEKELTQNKTKVEIFKEALSKALRALDV